MRNWFTFNGIDSRNFGIYISGSGRLTIPEKAYNMQHIAGRNGDLIVDSDATLQNELITYPAFIKPYDQTGIRVKFPEMFGRMRSWLMNVKGYAELRDSYDWSHFRLAAFAGPLTPETLANLEAGTFELEFNCKPQRYLTDDDEVYTVSAGQSLTIEKCSIYHSEPLFRVNRAGSFSVGDEVITISAGSYAFPVFIDCRLLECYDLNGNSVNRYVTFSNYNFPSLEGETVITSTNVELTVLPRWFEL